MQLESSIHLPVRLGLLLLLVASSAQALDGSRQPEPQSVCPRGPLAACFGADPEQATGRCEAADEAAPQADKAAAKKGACEADVQKFCADVRKGAGRRIACMNEHLAELSPECRKVIEQRSAKPRQGVCAADMQKFCGDVRTGGGRRLACMNEHLDELSPECRKAVEQGPAAKKQQSSK